jgi:hypothetical protein
MLATQLTAVIILSETEIQLGRIGNRTRVSWSLLESAIESAKKALIHDHISHSLERFSRAMSSQYESASLPK